MPEVSGSRKINSILGFFEFEVCVQETQQTVEYRFGTYQHLDGTWTVWKDTRLPREYVD